jgi:hypothetical protein
MGNTASSSNNEAHPTVMTRDDFDKIHRKKSNLALFRDYPRSNYHGDDGAFQDNDIPIKKQTRGFSGDGGCNIDIRQSRSKFEEMTLPPLKRLKVGPATVRDAIDGLGNILPFHIKNRVSAEMESLLMSKAAARLTPTDNNWQNDNKSFYKHVKIADASSVLEKYGYEILSCHDITKRNPAREVGILFIGVANRVLQNNNKNNNDHCVSTECITLSFIHVGQ